jgi:hypothetical protein
MTRLAGRTICAALVLFAATLGSAGSAAAASPTVVVGYTDSLHFFGPSPLTLSGPALGAGTWWVTATAELDASGGSASAVGEVACQLVDSSSKSVLDTTTRVPDYGHATGRAVMSLVLTGVDVSMVDWHPDLVCSTKASTSVEVTFVRIDAVSGSLTSTGGPRLKASSSGSATFPGDSNFHAAGSIKLPAGRWTVLAKADVSNPSLSVPVTVTCRLSPSASDTDKTAQSLAKRLPTPIGTEGELAVNVAHVFTTTTNVFFDCRGDSAGGFSVGHVQIIALQAGVLVRQPLGASPSSSGTGTPVVDAGFKTSSVAVPHGSSLSKIASLPLAAGKWYVFAKASVSDTDVRIECHLAILEGGGFLDDTFMDGDAGGSSGIYLQNGIDASTAVHAAIKCNANASGVSFKFIRLTALKATSISFVFLN